jgi:hypothetical protein
MAEAGISGMPETTTSTASTRGIELTNNPSSTTSQPEITSGQTGSSSLQEGIQSSSHPSGDTAAAASSTTTGAASTSTDMPPTLGATPADGTAAAPDNQTLRIKIMNATGNPSHNQYIFTITPPYLRKRGVEVETNDPFNLTIAQVKELIWRDWRRFS